MSGSILNSVDYKAGVRGGREVSVRDIHEEILPIMDEVDRICRKYGITYGLLAGSALGAVNYAGFIPWDDDMDIFIKREDWGRFIEALDKELGDDFYYQCYSKDRKFNILIPQMKIRKRGTYIEEENILLDNKCSGNGLFVDVVMYGEVNKNKFVDEVARTIIKILTVPILVFDNLGINPNLLKMLVIGVDKVYTKISRGSGLISQPITIPWEKFMHEPVFSYDDVYPVREYDFEGRKFYSYNNIEKVLKSWYGDNCLKRWNEEKHEYEETLDVSKRCPKHIRDINLSSDCSLDGRPKFWLKVFVWVTFLCFVLGIGLLFISGMWMVSGLLFLIFLVNMGIILS